MDMEKLTKQQIVLVTLLISFVTSIATGIVTVALMDQAPPGITQTINRVVERTIEKVVTEPANNNNSAAVITRETIVVKEDDKIVESVDKNKNSIVRIYSKSGDPSPESFFGLGTIVSKEGLIVTGEAFVNPSSRYLVSVDNKIFHEATVVNKREGQRFYFLKIMRDDKNPISFEPVIFSDSNSLKLGQTVISLSGFSQNSVSTGIVSSIIDAGGKENQTNTGTTSASEISKVVVGIKTNINPTDSLVGGPLLNLYGEMVGLRVSPNISDKYDFLPSNILKGEISNVI